MRPAAGQTSYDPAIDSGMTDHLLDQSRQLIDQFNALTPAGGPRAPDSLSMDRSGYPAWYPETAEIGGDGSPTMGGDGQAAPDDQATLVTPVQPAEPVDLTQLIPVVAQRRLKDLENYLSRPGIEGFTNPVQLDTTGNPTAGYGHEVRPGDHLKLGNPVDPNLAQGFLDQDGSVASSNADQQALQAKITDPNLISRLAAVNFQMGTDWPQKFPKAYGDMVAGKYDAAANEVGLSGDGKSKSKWAIQTPVRVREFQDALRALAPNAHP
jgi:hypothetical protein